MTDTPPTMDYTQPPRQRYPFGLFVLGVISGFLLVGVAVVLLGSREENLGYLLLVPLGVVVAGLVLAIGRATRAFGLGLAAACPIGLLVLLAICGVASMR